MSLLPTTDSLTSILMDPQSIFYGPYIICALVITFGALIFAGKMGPVSALKVMFDKNVWLTRSAFTDVAVSVIYMTVFNVPTVVLQTWIAVESYEALRASILTTGALGFTLTLNPFVEAALASLLVVLCFDFSTFLAHWGMHKVPAFWDIHSVHHSPEKLNFFSAYRQHPFDRLIRNSLGALFTALGMAVFHAIFPSGATTWSILGMGIGFFVFMLTVNLQHSHVPVHYPKWLRIFVLSPHLHQIHHSADMRHRDKNFGGIFPYWDRLFGTYHDEPLAVGSLKFGLDPADDPYKHSVWKCYVQPFISIFRRIGPNSKG